MNAHIAAAAKSYVLLAVIALLPPTDIGAALLFVLIRHQEHLWDPQTVRVKHPPGRPRRKLRAVVWEWRVEFGLAIAVTVARAVAGHLVGYGLADLATTAAVGYLIAPGGGGWAKRKLLAVRRRRRWESALAAVLADAAPTIEAIGADRSGEWADVRVAPGATVTDLAGRVEALAAFLAVAEVRVQRRDTNAGAARIRALRSDPLAGPAIPWPPPARGVVDLWQPVPVGVDEDGQRVTVTLFEHNLLLGGEPGAGKSVAMHQLVAAAALDPQTVLWLCDPKLVELACWRPVAHRFAGNDVAEATALLRDAQRAMDQRYQQLLADGGRKVAPGAALHLVVIDELAHYLTGPDKKLRDAFTDVLRDLVSRGRAAGVVVVAATQKPASEVIPTSLRDLFGYRWALRCTTPAASDTILGTGWATQGISAATINPALRGLGYLLHESGQPVRLRAYHLDDDTVAQVAAHAARLRQTATPAGNDRE